MTKTIILGDMPAQFVPEGETKYIEEWKILVHNLLKPWIHGFVIKLDETQFGGEPSEIDEISFNYDILTPPKHNYYNVSDYVYRFNICVLKNEKFKYVNYSHLFYEYIKNRYGTLKEDEYWDSVFLRNEAIKFLQFFKQLRAGEEINENL